MKYKEKPIIIEAFKLTDKAIVPKWFKKNMNNGVITATYDENGCAFFITTLEGEMKAVEGDYIIKGINGEIYPCKSDIFEKTYELVDEES